MPSYSGSFDDDEVVCVYQSTNGGVRTVKTKKLSGETIAQWKARHIAAIEDEMSIYPPAIP